MTEKRPIANLQPGTQSACFWVDESGAKNTANDCFVIAAIKTRHPDDLQRAIQAVRDQHHNTDEMKFGRVKESNAKVCRDVIDVLEESDARLVATVVDGSVYNPFRGGTPVWSVHADIVTQMLVGSINKNEIATVMMDVVSTPPDRSMGSLVKRQVNSRIGATTVVTAVTLNSKTNDCLQAADLVAGAIFHERLRTRAGATSPEKARVARHLAATFGVDNLREDVRSKRFNIVTLKQPRPTVKKRNGRLV